MTTYFSDKSFRFLRALARNNERAWFQAHKADYEAHVRGPFLQLLVDLQPALAEVSGHYRSDPKPVGGSLFRLHRDTRFANDKTPTSAGRARACSMPADARSKRPRSTCTWSPAPVSSARASGIRNRPRNARSASSSSKTRAAGRPRRTRRHSGVALSSRPMKNSYGLRAASRRISSSSTTSSTAISSPSACWTMRSLPGRNFGRWWRRTSRAWPRSWITCVRRWTWSSEARRRHDAAFMTGFLGLAG